MFIRSFCVFAFIVSFSPLSGSASALQSRSVAQNSAPISAVAAISADEPEPDTVSSVEKLTLGFGNDSFATATVLTLFGSFSGPESWTKTTSTGIYGDNFGTTKETGEPNHEGQAGGHSVWFKLTVPRSARIDFVPQATSTNFTTLLGVYTGSAVNTLTSVALTYSGSPAPLATRSFTASAWTTYYVAIDGASGASGNFGFVLNYDPTTTAPDNDNFARARDLTPDLTPTTGALYSIYGDNFNATKETGEPDHDGKPGGHSVWWKWTMPSNTRVSLNSSVSDFTASMGIYTGTAVNALGAINRSPTETTTQARSFDAVAGTTYYIAVDGVSGAMGNIQLLVSFAAGSAPVITNQPTDLTLPFDTNGQIQLTLGGGAVTSYQWYRNGEPYNGMVGATGVGFSHATSNDAGAYYVVLSNSWGSVTSATANVTVTGTAPTITAQPKSQIVAVGDMAQFYVTAVGEAPLSYQWFYNGKAVANATGASFYVPNVTSAAAGSYTVTVTNRLGSVTSDAAVLTVGTASAPMITTQPASQTVTPGASVTFSVAATSTLSLSYQWYYNGSLILPPTNSPTLQLTNVQTANAGSYFVVVSNLAGSATSQVVTLTVSAATKTPPPVTPSGGGGGGGGGSISLWFLASFVLLASIKLYQQRCSV